MRSDGYVAEAADLVDAGGSIELVAGAVVDGDVGDKTPARGEAILKADVEDVLMIPHRGWPCDLFVAYEVFVGVEDTVADVDGEVVEGEATAVAGAIVEFDELAHDALVGVCGDAPLSECVGVGGDCRGECDQKELNSIFHENPRGTGLERITCVIEKEID